MSPDRYDVVNATPMALTDKNLYAYCDNNPVTRVDADGEFWHIIIGAAVGAVINTVAKVVSNVIEGESWSDGLGIAALAGAASGALATSGLGMTAMVVGGAAISMAENAVNQVIENKGTDNFNVTDMLVDGAIGAITSAAGAPLKEASHLMSLGTQTVTRTAKTIHHTGLKNGIKAAGKAIVYYAKNTSQFYKRFLLKDSRKNLVDSVLQSGTESFLTCDFMNAQYQRIFGR